MPGAPDEAGTRHADDPGADDDDVAWGGSGGVHHIILSPSSRGAKRRGDPGIRSEALAGFASLAMTEGRGSHFCARSKRRETILATRTGLPLLSGDRVGLPRGVCCACQPWQESPWLAPALLGFLARRNNVPPRLGRRRGRRGSWRCTD